MTMEIATLVQREFSPPVAAAGFRMVPVGDARWLFQSPAGGVFDLGLDPREGFDVDYLDRGRNGVWTPYRLGLFLAKRADKARLERPPLPRGALDETRLTAELAGLRRLFEQVGADLLAGDRRWQRDYPWPVVPNPAEVGRELDRLLEIA